MSLNQSLFGTLADGRRVSLYTFESPSSRITWKITDFGGRIVEIITPDRKGDLANINLGYASLASYTERNPYFGAAIGRVANRIGKASFELEGRVYQLPANNGPNTLHGGAVGFDKLLWSATASGDSVKMTLVSPDGDQGFPGEVVATMTYSMLADGSFQIDYEATASAPTPVNLTHHPYFNLGGAGNGTILDHELTIHANAYTPVGETLIPTGEIKELAGTPFDFASPHTVGSRLGQVPGGYDHNFCLADSSSRLKPAALMRDPATGRHMEILTTYPGIQFYSGNFLDGSITGLGGNYPKHGGFCLETQLFPDAVHHPHFPNTILRPGERYRHSTVYRLFAR